MQNYTGYGWEGKDYDRTLGIKDIAKVVRQQLKKEYPKCKFSVQIQRYSGGQSLYVSLMEGPWQAIAGNRQSHWEDGVRINKYSENTSGHAQLNQYAFTDGYDAENGVNNGTVLTRDAWDCMKRVTKISKGFNYDDSDSMIDYFSTNFYLHLNIGKWNKPFVQTQ